MLLLLPVVLVGVGVVVAAEAAVAATCCMASWGSGGRWRLVVCHHTGIPVVVAGTQMQ